MVAVVCEGADGPEMKRGLEFLSNPRSASATLRSDVNVWTPDSSGYPQCMRVPQRVLTYG